jgi:hypothetical protein
MPAAERYELSVYEQASLTFTATLYTDDAATTLQNLTGYSASMRIMDKPSGTVIATLTSGSGITLGGSAGTVAVSRTPGQVQAWKIDTGAYDLTIASASGVTTMICHGSLEVVKT